jgi:DNA-binding LytR/AlgR family response regulator
MIYPTHQADPTPSKRSARKGKFPLFFFIRHERRNLKIRVADINYIEARKNYCRIVTKSGAFLTMATLKSIESILPPEEFCRIHRAFIVSLDWIASFDHGAVYGPDQQLPIGELYRPALLQRVLIVGVSRRTGDLLSI